VQLQNGPGVPRWQYQSYVLQWNGPVEPSQSLRLVVLTPAWVSLWRLLAITLLAVLLAALARGMLPPANTAWIQRWFVRFRESPGTTASVAWIALVSLLLVAPRISNAEVPSKDLLDELARRLSRAPECAPSCVNVASASVRLDGDELVGARRDVEDLRRERAILLREPDGWMQEGDEGRGDDERCQRRPPGARTNRSHKGVPS